jgi:hypothetical protein
MELTGANLGLFLAAVSERAPFYAALLLTTIGAIIVVIAYLWLPQRRGRKLEQRLQAAGIRAAAATAAEGAPSAAPLVRELVVPAAVAPFKQRLVRALGGGWSRTVEAVTEETVTVAGRPWRFLNVNRVNPQDFSRAEFRVQRLADCETRVAYQVQFAGFKRVIVVVAAFTAFAGAVMCIGPGNRANFVGVMGVLLAFDAFFVVVRYLSQVIVTQCFIDGLVLNATTGSDGQSDLSDG